MSPPVTPPENATGLNLDPSRDPNDQGRKLDVLNGKPDKDIYNPHTLQMPASPYELLAGTVIAASLITGLNSDLPGMVGAGHRKSVRQRDRHDFAYSAGCKTHRFRG